MSTKSTKKSFSPLNLWEVFCASCVSVSVSLIGTLCSLLAIFNCDYFDNTINVERFGDSVEIAKATIGLYRYSIKDEANLIESPQCSTYQSDDITSRLKIARFFSVLTPFLALAGCVFCVLGMKYLEARWTLWGMLILWSLTTFCQILGYSALRATHYCDTKDGQEGCNISTGAAIAIVAIFAHCVSIICAITIIQMKVNLKVQYAKYLKQKALRKQKQSSVKSEYASTVDLENQKLPGVIYIDDPTTSEESEKANQEESIALHRNASMSSEGKSRFSVSNRSLTHIGMTGEIKQIVSPQNSPDSHGGKRRTNSSRKESKVKTEGDETAGIDNNHARMSRYFEEKVLGYFGKLGDGCNDIACLKRANDDHADTQTLSTVGDNRDELSKDDRVESVPTEANVEATTRMNSFSVFQQGTGTRMHSFSIFQAGTGILNFLGPGEEKSVDGSNIVATYIEEDDLTPVSTADEKVSSDRKQTAELHQMPSFPKLLEDIKAMIAVRDEKLKRGKSNNSQNTDPTSNSPKTETGVEYDSVAKLVEKLVPASETEQESGDAESRKKLYDVEDCNNVLEDLRLIIAAAMQQTKEEVAERRTSDSGDNRKTEVDSDSISQMVDMLLTGNESGEQKPKASAEASVGKNKAGEVDVVSTSTQSCPMDEATINQIQIAGPVSKEGSQTLNTVNFVEAYPDGDEDSRTKGAEGKDGTETNEKTVLEKLNAAFEDGGPSACLIPCNVSKGANAKFEEAVLNIGAPLPLRKGSSGADQSTLESVSTAPSHQLLSSSSLPRANSIVNSIVDQSTQQSFATSLAESTRYDESIVQDGSFASGYESEDLIDVPECGPLTAPVRGALYAIGINGRRDPKGHQDEGVVQEEANVIKYADV